MEIDPDRQKDLSLAESIGLIDFMQVEDLKKVKAEFPGFAQELKDSKVFMLDFSVLEGFRKDVNDNYGKVSNLSPLSCSVFLLPFRFLPMLVAGGV
jgi:hypothetical protein